MKVVGYEKTKRLILQLEMMDFSLGEMRKDMPHYIAILNEQNVTLIGCGKGCRPLQT